MADFRPNIVGIGALGQVIEFAWLRALLASSNTADVAAASV
jgi:hypothetical protein